ncbi:hypothetical protein BOTBODRAFT_169670 [Botryobasidium botryosum FD-172 SS1]|uniref:HAT C-terminal dimerisation domain-containing protein n=1 Tax=Botryobasidium botryosum (strain FD-172 SS1) TaxID=930990 RepID=A0A067N211_BOTB1|nr:hypothetical protein BOTBODRAFT_169670 [Botryobasidium botryosum FD-172 SS1]
MSGRLLPCLKAAGRRVSANEPTPPPSTSALSRSSAPSAGQAQTNGLWRLRNLTTTARRSKSTVGGLTAENTPSHENQVPSDEESRSPTKVDNEAEEINDSNVVDWEIERWTQAGVLKDPRDLEDFDLLRFWQTNAREYPLIYKIALDVLPMQASAVLIGLSVLVRTGSHPVSVFAAASTRSTTMWRTPHHPDEYSRLTPRVQPRCPRVFPQPIGGQRRNAFEPKMTSRLDSSSINISSVITLGPSFCPSTCTTLMPGTSFDEKRPSSEDLKYDGDIEVALDYDTLSSATQATGAEFDDPNVDIDAIGDLDDSPYPEVRSAVSNTDDPDMPVNTIRAWAIGIILLVLVTGLNQLASLSSSFPGVSTLLPQLVAFPMGHLAARALPDITILGCRLNPGPFTIKEHVLIAAVTTSLGGGTTDIFAVQRTYYNQNWGFLYQWLVTMSTQLIGFSFGGITRQFLVDPPSMITPSALVQCVLLNTLHSQQYAGMGNRGGISRARFLVYAVLGSFLWYFVPGYLFTALSCFSWVTWIAPTNVKINQMFGYSSGLGMSVLTFDWGRIICANSALAAPWWAEVNIGVGFFVFTWLLTPILYYTNTWYGKFLPMSSGASYDNQMNNYNVSRVINADLTFNLEGYQNYSPQFLSMKTAVSYGLSFATVTATLVHAFLYYRKQIWSQVRRSVAEQPDIHAKLMLQYRQVPHWWYLLTFLSMFVCGVIAIEVWPTQLPVWAFVLALALSFLYTIPNGILGAISNQTVFWDTTAELIVGYALPGRPVAMMLFKSWGSDIIFPTFNFSAWLKIGHYMKIPPRVMFASQGVGTIIAGTTQLAVQAWMFSNIPGLCGKSGFTCPTATESIFWGVIGPARMFSPGQIYHGLTYFFLIGALLPIVPWWLTKKYPKSWYKYINIPIILSVAAPLSPGNMSWLIVGFIFQFLIRRRHFSWWAKYNYVLSAALDIGAMIAPIFILLCLQNPLRGAIGANSVQTWWGNTVYKNTADAKFTPLITLADGEKFGVNLDKRQVCSFGGKLGEWLWHSQDLVKLLTLPDSPEAMLYTTVPSDTKAARQSLGSFNSVPMEVINHIFSEIDTFCDAFALAHTNTTLLAIGQKRMSALCANRLAHWAGDRLVCIGDYAENDDMPTGVLTDDEMEELAEDSTNLFHLAGGFDGAEFSHWTLDDSRFAHRLSHADSVKYRAFTSPVNYNKSSHVLCNISKHEYVRQDVSKDIVALPDTHTFFSGELKDFGPVITSRICWSSDGSVSMYYEGGIHRGVWAGDRFDIVSQEEMARRTQSDKGWKDVTEEVRAELNTIWKLDGFCD